VQHHYNANRRQACVKRPTRSLETKWGIIKHDVAKFCGNYSVVNALCELRTSNEDTFQKSLKLYNIKHSRCQSFTFFHCWLILKDLTWWANTHKESKNMLPQKHKSCGNLIKLNKSETKLLDAYKSPFLANIIPKRP